MPTRKTVQSSMNHSNGTDWLSFTHIEHHAGAASSVRRFVFRFVEESAKREWLVMNRKGPWEGYSRLAQSRPLSPSRLPLSAHFHQERDVWVRGSYTKEWNRTYLICDAPLTFETGEAQFRLVTEIVPKSLICVNGSSYECWRKTGLSGTV